MSNSNCENVKNYNSCNSCNYCDSCDSCNYCYSCDSCYSCNYCNYCDSCDSCNYCDSCDSCYSCNSCNYCDSCNSCYSCKGLRMSEKMLFCLGEGKYESKGNGYQKNYMVFNQKVDKDEWDKIKSSLPTIKLQITKWIDKDDMTKQEKKDVNIWKEIGGYLKRFSYDDAWKNWIDGASKEDKEAILNCNYYDSDIFEKITGCKLELDDRIEIVVEGKKTMISRASAKALNFI